MKRLAVIGYPIKHSLSPAMHQAALDELGIDTEYVRVEVATADLAAFVEEIREGQWAGVNVTVPHKEAILPLLDELAPEAAAIGAVNTVVVSDDRLVGHNTDASGFRVALHDDGGFDPAESTVAVLGAGGASRAVVWSLCELGARTIHVVNRSANRAEALVSSTTSWGTTTQVAWHTWPDGWDEWCNVLSSCHLVVNATTIGLVPGEMPAPASAMLDGTTVMDLIYNPRPTRLLAEASGRLKTIDGLSMLVYQGAAAFELWTGMNAPIQTMREAAEKALAAGRRENRVGELLGTPLMNPAALHRARPRPHHGRIRRRRSTDA